MQKFMHAQAGCGIYLNLKINNFNIEATKGPHEQTKHNKNNLTPIWAYIYQYKKLAGTSAATK